MDEREFLGASLDALDFNAGEARRNVEGLSASLLRNADANSRASQSHEVSARKISSQLSRAFSDLVTDGDKLSDVMRKLGLSIADTAFQAAIRPITNQIGSGISGVINGLMGFADGGAFSQGKVMPFARGGRCHRSGDVPDAGRHRVDGRSGARGDHAAGARIRWQIGCARGCGWFGPGQRCDEHIDAGCGEFPTQSEPDCGADEPRIVARPTESVGS